MLLSVGNICTSSITQLCVDVNTSAHVCVPGIPTANHPSMCKDAVPHCPGKNHPNRPPSGARVAPHTWLVFSTGAWSVGGVNLRALPFSQPLRILASLRLRQGRRKRPLARMTTQGTSSVRVKVGGR